MKAELHSFSQGLDDPILFLGFPSVVSMSFLFFFFFLLQVPLHSSCPADLLGSFQVWNWSQRAAESVFSTEADLATVRRQLSGCRWAELAEFHLHTQNAKG